MSQLDQELRHLFNNITNNYQLELASITDANDLEQFWLFKYNTARTQEQNMYEFYSMLNIYQRRCRDWESMHHGTSCVVERVRDQYLMPKIKEFLKNLAGE